MEYIVYRTTCLINNKIYVGVHKTENSSIFDGYLGRGFFIGRTHYLQFPKSPFHYALIKYGVNSFKREVLYVYNDEESAYNKEAEIVTEDFIYDESTYNIAIGGKGRPRPMQPVFQFNFKGNLIESYDSALEASKIIERDISNIYGAINNKRTCKNSLWSYSKSIDISTYKISSENKYYLYNAEGFLIDEFEHSIEIINFLNTNYGNLNRAVKANYKISGYFISMEKFDKLQIVVSKLSGKLNRYTKNGIYIDSFNTIKEAKEKLNLKLNGISTAIKLDRSCNGFKWTRNNNPPINLNKNEN